MAPSIDEFQDLTQFADESFDTEDVDLFEFSDDEDSPLLRLKSIVLSLDWDITEDILKELNEELANLRAMWKDDRVAQIYLQGMENVGKYMREEGAYAHPNAIKLLLTLYHNYEKIISSPNLSGDSVTAMLKADIRKFKVLQYQISTLKNAQGGHSESVAEEAASAASPVLQLAKQKGEKGATVAPSSAARKKESAMPPPLRSMEATILGLEWEVTDEGLEKFNTEATELRKHLNGNNEAQVLIQGLQALGAYIREQKTESHPDAFTILHSFYDSLKMLLESPQLGAEQRRQILIEQISSLNSLKEVIARSVASKSEEEDVDEEPESEAEEEEVLTVAGGIVSDLGADEDSQAGADDNGTDFSFSFDEEEKEDVQPPSVKSKPKAVPVKPVIASLDDEDDSDLGTEEAGADDDGMDFSFSFNEEEKEDVQPPSAKSKPKAVPVKPVVASSDDEDEFDDDLFSDSAGGGVMPALADEDEEGGFSGSLSSADISEERAAELDEKLDSFFNFGDEEPKPKKNPVSTPSPAAAKKSEKMSLATLLEDTPDKKGEEEENADLDSSFFNFDDEDSVADAGMAAISAVSEDDTLGFDDTLFGDEIAKPVVSPAILRKEEDSQSLSAVSAEDEEDDDELDDFFNFDDELTADQSTATEKDDGSDEVPVGALADGDDKTSVATADEEDKNDGLSSGIDSFFSFDEDEDSGQPKAGAVDEVFPSDDEEGSSISLDAGLFGSDEVPVGALADGDGETGAATADGEDKDDGLSSGIDSFFSFDEDEDSGQPKAIDDGDEDLVAAGADIDIDRAAEIKDKLDSFFSFEEETSADLLAGSASADEPEEMPELNDDLITALDDDDEVAVGGQKEEDFFAVNADNNGREEKKEPAEVFDGQNELFGLNEEKYVAAVEESLTEDSGEDTFFAFGEGDEGPKEKPVSAVLAEAESGSAFDSFLSADAADEEFFCFNADGAKEEPAVGLSEQDELFGGLNAVEKQDSSAEKIQDDEQNDTFFSFVREDQAGDSESVPEEDRSATEETELFALKMEESESEIPSHDDDDLLLDKEYEADSEPVALFVQDELPDPFISSETEESEFEPVAATSRPASIAEIFSSLTAVAAALPAVPSGHHLRQVSELAVAAMKEPSVSPYQSIVLNLLDSSAALLAKAPQNAAGSGAIVQEFAAGLAKADEPFILAGMISRYTSWQQDFFARIINGGSQPECGTPKKATPPSVQEEFSQLRQELLAEIRQLKQELLADRG